MAKYLQCTMSAGIDFRIERKSSERSPIAQFVKVIHVAGGANVRDNHSIMTPIGAMTEVSDEEFAALCANRVFSNMKANGYIVVTEDHHLDVKDNKKKDKSAQKTPEHYEKTRKGRDNPVPTTGGIDTDA